MLFRSEEDFIWAKQPPILVVEINSRSIRTEHKRRKPGEYAQPGVGQYWLLDRVQRTLTVIEHSGDFGAVVPPCCGSSVIEAVDRSRSMWSMSVDASLFGDDEPREVLGERTPAPIADWQVDLLRKALDARGLETMAERQQAIEAAAGRAVESLRALTGDDAIGILNKLGRSAARRSGGTNWDERDEDTWIDRL